MLEKLTHHDFRARVGETFTVLAEQGGRRPLELVDVAVFAPAGEGLREAFTLAFRESTTEPHLPQQIFRVEHEGLGAFDLFLVPRGPMDGGMRYDADFT